MGTEVPIGTVPRWAELAEEMQFSGIKKLPIGYFIVPLGNNRDSGSPLGVSVYSRAIKQIEDADRRYTQINWEYDSKETAVHIARACLNTIQLQTVMIIQAERNVCTGASNTPLARRTSRFWMSFRLPSATRRITTGWNQQMRLIEFRCNRLMVHCRIQTIRTRQQKKLKPANSAPMISFQTARALQKR